METPSPEDDAQPSGFASPALGEVRPPLREALVKANPQISCASNEESLERLRSTRGVVEVWRD
jgi:hypothetical protein